MYSIPTCPQTIIDQIGGIGRLQAMLGTKAVMYGDNSVLFDFKGNRKMNKCRISYVAGLDLYNVEFFKYSPKKLTSSKVQDFAGIYADQLRSLFENTTGLYLSF